MRIPESYVHEMLDFIMDAVKKKLKPDEIMSCPMCGGDAILLENKVSEAKLTIYCVENRQVLNVTVQCMFEV